MDAAPGSSNRLEGSVPYCFILDEAYHVIMAGPSSGRDPLAGMYGDDAAPDVLPEPVERVVRSLTSGWTSARTATAAAADVEDMHVTVAPLHGYDGRRIAVFVRKRF